MKIGSGFTTGSFCRIEAAKANGVTLVIGDDVQINDGCHIAAIESVRIGNGVLMASGVYISDHDHGNTAIGDLKIPPASRILTSKPVEIMDNVWIGEKVIVLKGVKIGQGAVVAAGAVVTKDVEPFSVVAGVPARRIK